MSPVFVLARKETNTFYVDGKDNVILDVFQDQILNFYVDVVSDF